MFTCQPLHPSRYTSQRRSTSIYRVYLVLDPKSTTKPPRNAYLSYLQIFKATFKATGKKKNKKKGRKPHLEQQQQQQQQQPLGNMTSAMCPFPASAYPRSSLKRKRDELVIAMSSTIAPLSSLVENGQACHSTREVTTTELRGEIHSRTMKRARNRPSEQDVHGKH